MTHYQELPQALMKEKHQGQTLTKEEVKVQTAHDLGVENVSKETTFAATGYLLTNKS